VEFCLTPNELNQRV